MPSSVTANLLDDGVVDTLVSVGAKSGVLALQLHKSATGMTVQFKDIVLKTD